MAYGRIYAKKVHYDGITFDSEMELIYYKELKERERKKEIAGLQVHPQYVLSKGFINANGKEIQPITYAPDFVYYDKELMKARYVDVKGMVLDEFRLKWHLFDKFLQENAKGCYLEVLKYSKTTGWVDINDYKKEMKKRRLQLIEEKNYYKNIVLKQEREKAKIERQKQREKERYTELLKKSTLYHLTYAERKRLEVLRKKIEGEK